MWQNRMILWTDDTLYVAREDSIVENIPLHEVVASEEMNDDHMPEQTMMETNKSQTFKQDLNKVQESSLAGNMKNAIELPSRKNLTRGQVQTIIQLRTVSEGINFGRVYYFKPSIETPASEMITRLSDASREAQQRSDRKSRFEKSQEFARRLQQSTLFQIAMGVLIMLVRGFHDSSFFLAAHVNLNRPAQNFVANVADSEMAGSLSVNGTPTELGQALEKLDSAFTAVFTAELLINAYAHWLLLDGIYLGSA